MLEILIEMLPTSLIQALLIALLAIGVMIPFKLLNLPDLTAEGSYPIGAIICATMLVSNVDPISAIIGATAAGGLLGLFTAFLYLRYNINTLLAGIIVSTITYSINLRIMGRPSIALFDATTIFSCFTDNDLNKILLLTFFLFALTFLLFKFLNTEKGLRFRTTGLNQNMAYSYGVNKDGYVLLGFFIANCFNAFSGAIIAQVQAYVDINMGVGIVINALAALMIGETIVSTNTLSKQLLSPIVGALVYQLLQSIVLTIGFEPSDFRMITGILVIFALALKAKKLSP
jgi:putative ABC transport system permease protein